MVVLVIDIFWSVFIRYRTAPIFHNVGDHDAKLLFTSCITELVHFH